MNIPRIRCKSGQIESPPELAGKWCFTVSLWTFDGETQIGDDIGPFGAFDTQEQAINESKKAAQMACEDIEKNVDGKVSGKYLDMKNGGIMRSWVEN